MGATNYCPNCGQPVGENAKFCRNCGADLTPTVDSYETNTNKTGTENFSTNEDRQNIRQKRNNHAIPVVIAVFLLIIVGLGIGFFMRNNSNAYEKPVQIFFEDLNSKNYEGMCSAFPDKYLEAAENVTEETRDQLMEGLAEDIAAKCSLSEGQDYIADYDISAVEDMTENEITELSNELSEYGAPMSITEGKNLDLALTVTVRESKETLETKTRAIKTDSGWFTVPTNLWEPQYLAPIKTYVDGMIEMDVDKILSTFPPFLIDLYGDLLKSEFEASLNLMKEMLDQYGLDWDMTYSISAVRDLSEYEITTLQVEAEQLFSYDLEFQDAKAVTFVLTVPTNDSDEADEDQNGAALSQTYNCVLVKIDKNWYVFSSD